MNELSRRRYQAGQLIDDKDRWIGRWREDVLDVTTGQMRRIRRQEILGSKKELPSKRLAQRALAEQLKSVNAEDYTPVSNITFFAFAEKWQTEIMRHHKPSSQDGERTIIRRHLIPVFGPLALKDVTLEVVQRFVNDWEQSPKTLRNVIVLLMGMWDHAQAWGYATHNPFPRGVNGRVLLKMPRMSKPKTYAFSLEETVAIIDKADGPWKLLFRTLAEGGMRPGELAGMRKTDLKGRVIRLAQSVYRQKIQTPKTENAYREFPITQALANDLRQFMAETEGQTNPYGLVWTSATGQPLHMGKVLSQVLNPILDELGIRAKLEEMGITRCGNYAFRHMNVTEMRRLGVPLKTIQQRVGHAQGSDITDKHYVHAVDSDNLAASDLMGNLLSTKTEGRLQ